MSDILLPELGEGIDSVEIRDVLVKKGDLIKSIPFDHGEPL